MTTIGSNGEHLTIREPTLREMTPFRVQPNLEARLEAAEGAPPGVDVGDLPASMVVVNVYVRVLWVQQSVLATPDPNTVIAWPVEWVKLGETRPLLEVKAEADRLRGLAGG